MGTRFDKERRDVQTIHPPVALGERCSELGRGAQPAAEALFLTPARQLHPQASQLPGPPVASLAPESPEGLQSLQPDLTAFPRNDTMSAGRPRVAWAGKKSGFISQDPQALDLESWFCLHDCGPAASLAPFFGYGPACLGHSLMLSPAPSPPASPHLV